MNFSIFKRGQPASLSRGEMSYKTTHDVGRQFVDIKRGISARKRGTRNGNRQVHANDGRLVSREEIESSSRAKPGQYWNSLFIIIYYYDDYYYCEKEICIHRRAVDNLA